jgi:hypothetical protein
MVIVVLISFLSLYQVHYNYTGKINLATDATVSYHQVKNMVYQYPYFSDEWYAVSLVNGAIGSHSLPVRNILANTFFVNLELFFHSFLAGIILLLGLNPLSQYAILSIFFNSIIILLIYLFLRVNNIPKITSGVCSLLGLYIACGANLPGLWHLIPFNLGIMFFLISVCFMEFGDIKTAVLSTILGSLFYLPLVPFYFTALLAFIIYNAKIPKENLFKIISGIFLFLFFAIPVAYILIMISSFSAIAKYIFSRIFYISVDSPFIPQLYFYNVIPAAAILLAILGLYRIYKNKKWILLSEFILCAIFWIFYSFTLSRFFIEYERVVIFASIIVVIISGFGLKQFEEYIKFKFGKIGAKVLKMAETAALLVFLVLVPFYTQGENWKNMILVNPKDGTAEYPKAPANNYLTQDDLKIFKGIENKSFLSLPWKGTAIGVATYNHPILAKEGTISIGSNDILNNFINADCAGKQNMAKSLNLDYIYLYKFNCPGFEKINQSAEGLVLYKYEQGF